MSTHIWPDPVDVLVHVQSTENSWVWAVAWAPSNSREDASVEAGTAASHADALISAFSLLDDGFKNTPVNLYSEDPQLVEAVRALAKWPNVEAHDNCKARTHRLRKYATEQLAASLAKPAEPALPVVVSVDGSYSNTRHTGGWAWVDENGRWGQGAGSAVSAVHSELNAIALALKKAGSGPVVIRCDCREAIELALNGPKPSTATRLRPTLTRLRAAKAYANATFEWVPGHAGDALNEAANRLAIAARRDLDAGTCPETAEATAQAIIAEHEDAWRMGECVPATRKVGAAS